MGYQGYMGSWNDLGSQSGSAGPGVNDYLSDASRQANGEGRAAFQNRFRALLQQLQEFVDLDEICDDSGVDFMSRRLPPAPPSLEGQGSDSAAATGGSVEGSVTLETDVRWVDRSAVRAMLSIDPETSEATVMLFHSCSNPRDGHMSRVLSDEAEEEVGCLRFEISTFLPALRKMLALAPGVATRCGELPLEAEDDRVALCENLLEAGLIEVVPGQAEKGTDVVT